MIINLAEQLVVVEEDQEEEPEPEVQDVDVAVVVVVVVLEKARVVKLKLLQKTSMLNWRPTKRLEEGQLPLLQQAVLLDYLQDNLQRDRFAFEFFLFEDSLFF
jgi:hypothetical protein